MRRQPVKRQPQNQFASATEPAQRTFGGFQPLADADDAPQHIGQPRPDGGHCGIEALVRHYLVSRRIVIPAGRMADRRRIPAHGQPRRLTGAHEFIA